jgi:hypothetical protein
MTIVPGLGFMVMAALTVLVQPVALSVSVKVTRPEPFVPHFTEIVLVPCPPEMVPPVTVHTYV